MLIALILILFAQTDDLFQHLHIETIAFCFGDPSSASSNSIASAKSGSSISMRLEPANDNLAQAQKAHSCKTCDP